MDEKSAHKVTVMLAEIVAGAYAEEQHIDTCKRMERAKRLLKRVAPEVLKAAEQRSAALQEVD